MGLKDVLNTVRIIRESSNIPITIMIYYDVVFCIAIEKFLVDAREIGVDGLIIPDISLEEREELLNKSNDNWIYLIPLVAPTSKDRIKNIISNGKGFVYCISSNGVTGERSSFNNIENYLKDIREFTKLPLLLGFGI